MSEIKLHQTYSTREQIYFSYYENGIEKWCYYNYEEKKYGKFMFDVKKDNVYCNYPQSYSDGLVLDTDKKIIGCYDDETGTIADFQIEPLVNCNEKDMKIIKKILKKL